MSLRACRPRWRGVDLMLAAAVLMAAGTAAAQQAPMESTVTKYDRTYVTFYNVMLLKDKILFYLPDEQADGPRDDIHDPPSVPDILQWQYWDRMSDAGDLHVEIVDKHNKAYYPQTCSDWVQQPAIVYCGIEWDQLNIYHFFLDNFIRMFAAISDIGAFSQEKFLSWAGLPSSSEANLVIISGRAESYTSGFAYLFDYITPDQWAWPKGVGACYKQLTVGADNAAMTYEDSYSPEDQLRKVDIFARFQRFALAAQLRNESMQGHHISVDQLSSRNSDLIQIGIISRDRDHWSHRLILNEGSVARALHRRYAGKVDVRLIYFNSTLTYAMEAVQQTDILIGVHGAGLTNVLWMKPGRVVVQLIPYGWDLNPGKIRGYRQLTANMECTHLVWVNRKHDNAYFDRYFFTWDFHQKEPPFAYREHPDPADVAAGKQINEAGGLHPQYLYQDTHVDIPSFLPVIDEAMRIMQQPEPAS